MTNYREILRLKFLGYNNTQIAQSVECSRTTVVNVLKLAEEKGLQYPLLEQISDKNLFETLYPAVAGKQTYKMPDFDYIHNELKRDGVTRDLLWREYVEECHRNGELPYQSTQFNKLYNDFLHKRVPQCIWSINPVRSCR